MNLDTSTPEQRSDFWRRLHAEIEDLRRKDPNCEVAINPFEKRSWDVKFTKRRTAESTSVTLAISEQATRTDVFLLAVVPTYAVGDTISVGERFLIPVLFDASSDRFLLHADHGPVFEPHIADFFARLTTYALMARLPSSFLVRTTATNSKVRI